MKNKQKQNIITQRDKIQEKIDEEDAKLDSDHTIGERPDEKPRMTLVEQLRRLDRLMEDTEED